MSRATGPLSGVVRVVDCGFAAVIFPIPIGIRARRIRARADIGPRETMWVAVGDCTAPRASNLDDGALVR